MPQESFFGNKDLPRYDCILCAAGAGSRMGDFKPLLPWQDATLADAAVRAALDAGCRVLLVAGSRGDSLEKRFPNRDRVRVVRHEGWDRGMVSSIQAGAALVGSPYFFVAHADMPLIGADVYRRLADAAAAAEGEGDADRPRAWRPVYRGRPGHPVLFSRPALSLIAAMPDGESLKPVLSACDLRLLPGDDPGPVLDLDDCGAYLRALGGPGRAAGRPVGDGPVGGTSAGGRLDGGSADLRVLVVTGGIGAGKTSAARRFFFRAVAAGLAAGLVSQVQTGRRDDGKAAGFDLELCRWADGADPEVRRLPLARRMDAEPDWRPGGAALELGMYRFDRDAFRQAADFAAAAAGSRVFVLDEIGRLELESRSGLYPALGAVLARTGPRLVVLAVRKDALPRLAAELALAAAAVGSSGGGVPYALIDLDQPEMDIHRIDAAWNECKMQAAYLLPSDQECRA